MRMSITEIVNITRLDRKRLTPILADLPHDIGPQQAKLYESSDALARIYAGDAYDDRKERARLTHHQANIASLDEKLKESELVSIDEVQAEWTEVNANVRAKLLGLPVKASPELAITDDPYQIQAILEGIIHEALRELHSEYADIPQDSESVGTTAKAKG